MTSGLTQQVINDLFTDLSRFGMILIPVLIIAVFLLAGAKILEMKGYQKWPAIFAIVPLFWIVMGGFDPRPERNRALTLRLALVFGPLNAIIISLLFIFG